MHKESRDLTLGQALDLGCQFAMAGQHDNAIGLFRGVLRHEPQNFEAIERLGASLFERGSLHEALYWFWRGRKLNRRHPMALSNYGLCLSQLGHGDEALPDLERACHFAVKEHAAPGVKALVYNNLGNTLERLGRHADALKALDRGIAADPADPFPHYNRGIALLRLNRQAEAIAAFDTSLKLAPPITDSASRLNAADAHYNRGMARLLLGDIEGGLSDYEHRLLTSENIAPNFGLPADRQWRGEDLNGFHTLLIHGEQGLGDDIQFFRFIEVLQQRYPGLGIKIMCHAATAPLLEGKAVQVLKPGTKVTAGEDYDCWCALMSLAHRLGVKAEADIPQPFFVPVPTERFEAWRDKLKLTPGRLHVGVCWAGNFLHKNDRHRSIALSTFARLFDAANCEFIGLQQIRDEDGPAVTDIVKSRDNVRLFYFDDFRDTAAAILNLDVVVSVDTAVAHLAATLGRPVFTLIPAFATDWRWQLKRADSPWYPSMTLVRQDKVGSWSTALDRLIGDLTELAAPARAA